MNNNNNAKGHSTTTDHLGPSTPNDAVSHPPSPVRFRVMTREETEIAIAVQKDRVERIMFKGEGADVYDEDQDEYPLFTHNSVMFHHRVARDESEEDFPGLQQRLARWNALSHASMEASTRAPPDSAPVVVPPIAYDVRGMLRLQMETEHDWRAQQRFIELVMEKHDHHIIAFWPQNHSQERVVDTLCLFQRCSVVLSPQPTRNKESHHHLGSLAAPADVSSIRKLQAKIRRHHHVDLTTIYMLYCEPHHIEMASLLFPDTRIVAITTPVFPHFEILMLRVLEARLTYPSTWTVDQKIAHLSKLALQVGSEMRQLEAKMEVALKNKVGNNK